MALHTNYTLAISADVRQGDIPIPFRCLDQHQQERLRAFTTGRGLADGAA
jgi:hypothetical protein